MMSDYWLTRQAKAQTKLTEKTAEEVNKQLYRYYQKSMRSTVSRYQELYDRVNKTIAEGHTPSPADLYKLDSYWKMQHQLTAEMRKLGDTHIEVLNECFVKHFQEVYSNLALPSDSAFGTISTDAAKSMINNVWCADGKSWSERVWENTAKLQQALNDGLMDCVITGKSPLDLKYTLQEQFGVSFNRANTLVKTELSHIQNQAAQQRYKDYGLEQFEVWADYDERRCDICGKLHKKRYNINANVPIPAHPNCRCSIIPVVED